MPTTTITIPAQEVAFDTDVWIKHTGMIGYATSYWAKSLDWDEYGITIIEGEESGIGEPRRKASWHRVVRVIEALGRGFRVDLEDNEHPDIHNQYAIAACRDFIHDPENADGDTDVDDLIIQLSIYGELVFG